MEIRDNGIASVVVAVLTVVGLLIISGIKLEEMGVNKDINQAYIMVGAIVILVVVAAMSRVIKVLLAGPKNKLESIRKYETSPSSRARFIRSLIVPSLLFGIIPFIFWIIFAKEFTYFAMTIQRAAILITGMGAMDYCKIWQIMTKTHRYSKMWQRGKVLVVDNQ